jgi:hypothetical protein
MGLSVALKWLSVSGVTWYRTTMSPSLSSHESALKLVFDARTFVAGERIFGIVELDFPMALEDKIEQVRVKFRGNASTYVSLHIPGFLNR